MPPLPLRSNMTDNLRFEGLTLTVASVAKSVAFYGEILGLDVAYNSEPAFAMIRIGGESGATIGLLSIEEAHKEGCRGDDLDPEASDPCRFQHRRSRRRVRRARVSGDGVRASSPQRALGTGHDRI